MSGRQRPTRTRRADLSQHFLRKARATRLIQATSISDSDFVIEIGAGRGALTEPLLRKAGRLLAIELDQYLAQKLSADFGGQVEILAADFLTIRLPEDLYKIVGNVPYSITTQIIRKLVEAPNPPTDGWLIVQRELAYRFCGRPYTSESLWSLRLKPYWHIEILDRLRRNDFDPPPSVDSVLLWLSHRGRPLLVGSESALYLEVIESAYRKGTTLKHAIRPWLSKIQIRRLASDLNFDLDEKPSALQFEQWLGIVRFIRNNR